MDEEFCPQVCFLFEEVQRLRAGLATLRDDFGMHNEVRRYIDILIAAAPVRPEHVVPPWDVNW